MDADGTAPADKRVRARPGASVTPSTATDSDLEDEDWDRRVADWAAGRRAGTRPSPTESASAPASYQPDPEVYEPPTPGDEPPRKRRFAMRLPARAKDIEPGDVADVGADGAELQSNHAARPHTPAPKPRHAAVIAHQSLQGVATWAPTVDAAVPDVAQPRPVAGSYAAPAQAPSDRPASDGQTSDQIAVDPDSGDPQDAATEPRFGGFTKRLRGLRKDEDNGPFFPPEPVAGATPAVTVAHAAPRPRPRAASELLPEPPVEVVAAPTLPTEAAPAPWRAAPAPRPAPRPALRPAPAPSTSAPVAAPAPVELIKKSAPPAAPPEQPGPARPSPRPRPTPSRPADPPVETPSPADDASGTDAGAAVASAAPETKDDSPAKDDSATEQPRKRRSWRGGMRATKLRRRLVRYAILILVVVLAALALRTYVVAPYYIPSQSMEPTLHGCPGCSNDDHVLVDKLSYRFHDPHAGDIVVFDKPANLNEPDPVLIKRVIGVGGDRLVLKHGNVFVNGRKIAEPYFKYHNRCPGKKRVTKPETGRSRWQIPDNDVFVMGDNRCNSTDSRTFGPIKDSSIVGRAFVIVWPLDRFTFL